MDFTLTITTLKTCHIYSKLHRTTGPIEFNKSLGFDQFDICWAKNKNIQVEMKIELPEKNGTLPLTAKLTSPSSICRWVLTTSKGNVTVPAI